MLKSAPKTRWMPLALAGVLAAGCATLSGPPDWVVKGTVIKDNEVYGVGAVTGIKNAPLAWETADGRARGMIAKFMETSVSLLLRDYAASMAGEEQGVERAQKMVVQATLHGVEPVDRYYDKATDTYYVLVRMDAERFKQALETVSDLNERMREHIRRRADRLFQELEREEAKRERREAGAPAGESGSGSASKE